MKDAITTWWMWFRMWLSEDEMLIEGRAWCWLTYAQFKHLYAFKSNSLNRVLWYLIYKDEAIDVEQDA